MTDVDRFLDDGFLHLPGAFSPELAAQGREILWKQIGLSPDNPAGWVKPVVWATDVTFSPVFAEAAGSPAVKDACDALVGAGRYRQRREVGVFPIRFPVSPPDDDRGWHIDGSFTRPDGKYGINLRSRERALLMLFLFSDVGEDDAPTRIRVGSHLDVPALLAPYGEDGVEFFAFGPRVDAATAHRPVVTATGGAGDVYLCHPFLVHAAQEHRGTTARFMSQPSLPLIGSFDVEHGDSPVEKAIRRGLG